MPQHRRQQQLCAPCSGHWHRPTVQRTPVPRPPTGAKPHTAHCHDRVKRRCALRPLRPTASAQCRIGPVPPTHPRRCASPGRRRFLVSIVANRRGRPAGKRVGGPQYRSRSSNRGGCRRTRSAPSGARAVSAPIGALRAPMGDGRTELAVRTRQRRAHGGAGADLHELGGEQEWEAAHVAEDRSPRVANHLQRQPTCAPYSIASHNTRARRTVRAMTHVSAPTQS